MAEGGKYMAFAAKRVEFVETFEVNTVCTDNELERAYPSK